MSKLRPKFNDGQDIIGFDGGNERGKIVRIIDSHNYESGRDEKRFFRGGICMNLVREISKTEFNRAIARHSGRGNWGFMRYDGKYFAVGESALPYVQDMALERRMNKAKYRRDHYGLIFLRGLHQIYGNDWPESVHVIAGHPPLNVEKREAIESCLRGAWDVQFMSEHHKIKIKTVQVIDEITGGALNLTLRIDGRTNGNALTRKGGKSLVFDLGGGTVDVAILDDRGYPLPGTHQSASIGLYQCILNFQQIFNEEFGELMPDSARGIPFELIYQIFLDPDHILRGVGGIPGGELDCSAIFTESVFPELNKLYEVVNNMVGTLSMAAARVIITGGAGDLLFKELAQTLFATYADNGALHRAADKGVGIFANVYGMAKFGAALRQAEIHHMRRG